jgi:hypothetical protein
MFFALYMVTLTFKEYSKIWSITEINEMEQDGTKWNKLKQDGTRWNKMKQDGTR